MVKERLQEYALIGEIIGAVGIVLSLLFVALELRQANGLAAAESLREGTLYWLEAYDKSIGSEESTAFMRKALHEYQELSEDEKGRFYDVVLTYVGAFDTLNNQYEAGLLREETYYSIARGYYGLMRMPGVQQLFKENDVFLPPYLLDPANNDAMAGRRDDLGRWLFLEK